MIFGINTYVLKIYRQTYMLHRCAKLLIIIFFFVCDLKFVVAIFRLRYTYTSSPLIKHSINLYRFFVCCVCSCDLGRIVYYSDWLVFASRCIDWQTENKQHFKSQQKYRFIVLSFDCFRPIFFNMSFVNSQKNEYIRFSSCFSTLQNVRLQICSRLHIVFN